MSKSWVTVVTTSSYTIGAKVLAASLAHTGSQYPLLVLATAALPPSSRSELEAFGLEVRVVAPLLLDSVAAGDNRAAFAEAGNKLRAFALTEYETLGFIDADTLVTRNIDNLLTAPHLQPDELAIAFACTCNNRRKAFYPKEWTSANCGHNRFTYSHTLPLTRLEDGDVAVNSGVMVFSPSERVCGMIEQFFSTHGDVVQGYVFPDQQILQDVFKGRIRILPWMYNALKVLRVCHRGLWDNGESNKNVHIVHYIHEKPWKKRCGGRPYPSNLPEWNELNVDPTHVWWWYAHDNYLSQEHQLKDV